MACNRDSFTFFLWKGCLSFKQYIPLKAAKFDVKTYELCEANSGYLWSLVVYAKDTHFQASLVTQKMNKTTAIVLHLVEPLLEKGHTVWLDNYYNFPALPILDETNLTILHPYTRVVFKCLLSPNS
jgi:hypothetical protein